MNLVLLILIGWGVMVLVMSGLWKLQQSNGKAGIVDVAWPLGVGGLATLFCTFSETGLLERRVLVAALAMVWGVRLSWHIWLRLRHETDDKRYIDLRDAWGENFEQRLFKFYQFQAFGALLFAIPMLIAAQNSNPLNFWDLLGVVIWFVAFIGESVADAQLKRFKSHSKEPQAVCREGLWRYSRHPNYFFEWLHWWSYVAFAILSPWGWVTLIGPIAMLYFILFVTGVPPAEASSLKSRGDAYRKYQQETNAFFPWFPKKNPVSLPPNQVGSTHQGG